VAVLPVIAVVVVAVGFAVSNASRFVPLSANATAGVVRSSSASTCKRARANRFRVRMVYLRGE
jgi:hypothetical protein